MYNKILCTMAVALSATLAIIPSAAEAQTTVSSPYVYDIADGEADMYGYLRFDTRMRDYGIVRFASNDYNNYTMTKSYGMIAGKSSVFTAGTMLGDKMLAFRATYYTNVFMPEGICLVDPNTGDYEMKWQYPDDGSWLIIDEMTYDPKTDRIFAMHYDTDKLTTDIYEVDRNTFALKAAGSISGMALLTLAADGGNLYGLTYSSFGTSNLVRIDESQIGTAATLSWERVGTQDTGIRVGNYSQSMEFDKTTHRLWWVAQTTDGNSYLVELNPTTGRYISRNIISGKPQVLSLCIPYQFVADNAPSYVRSLKATPTTKGGSDVKLSWTNPSTDYRGNNISSITSVKIYRGSTLAATLQDAKPGADMSWTDNNVANGAYIYKVVPANNAGDGIYRQSRTFVGYDVPAAPQNATLTASGKNATISWTAPQKGLNGGTFDKASLNYDVVRMPDNKQVATSTTATTVNDEAQIHAGYYYVVTAKNAQGKGGSATSNTVAFGPSYAIPFTSNLNTKDDFEVWTPVDNNGDGQTWGFEQYDHIAYYDRSEDYAADDWLFTPSLNFDGSKQYQLRFTYYSTNWVTADFEPVMEKMDVRYGTKQSPDAMTTVLKDLGEFHTSSGNYLYGKEVFKPNDGEGFIAFHAMSEKNHGRIFLKDVSIREYSAKDLSVAGFTGSATVNSTVKQTFTVTVANEGSAAVDDYTVCLINTATGDVIASAKGKKVEKDQTVDVPVDWTPGAEGEMTVSARVNLDGDTYPADNVATDSLKVRIAAADADKWLTLNNDENSGWLTPFYLDSKYYEGQCLYLEKEMQKKDISITGMQFLYNGRNTPSYTFPARIYMKHSEMSDLLQKEGSIKGIFEQNKWTKVFDGELTVGGNDTDSEFDVKLDKAFDYKGGNVNIRFMIPMHDQLLDTQYHPEWHFANVKGNSRFAFFRSDNDNINNDEIYTADYMPYIRLSYTENGTSGVLTPCSETLTIAFDGTEIRFSATAEHADITSASGVTVYTGKDVNSIGTSVLPSGTYIVRAIKDGKTSARKIVVR